MYKIEHFEEKFCGGDCFRFDDNNCGEYSIWQFCFWNRWQSFKQFVLYPGNAYFCRPDWFAFIYWFSLVLSLKGIYHSGREFLSIYYGKWTMKNYQKEVEEEECRVLPMIFQRNARLIGSAVMIKAWTGLFIGITTVTPSAIAAWLAIYSVTIFLDIILWIGESVFGKSKLDFRTCCEHLMPVGTLLMVRCIHGVFSLEIERRANIEELKLMSKLTKKW